MSDADPRRARLLELIDPVHQRGLELGALHNPVVTRDGHQILYVDHADTATLHAKYDGHGLGELMEVDVVWDRRLRDALGERGPVDYVVASHVIEHVPDLVSWLGELAEVLVPGGIVSLAIPDKRYCFDRRRVETQLADVVEAYVERRTRPSGRQVFDFWANLRVIDTPAAWEGRVDDETPLGQDELAMEKLAEAAASEEYVDVHCWVFTPASFLDVLGRLMQLGLVPWYEVARFHPTEPGSLEFHVSLRRLDDALPAEERLARQRASVNEAEHELRSGAARHAYVLLSDRERQVLQLKRRTLGAARRVVARARQAARRRR